MAAAEFFVPLDAVLSLGLPQAGATATFYLAGTTTKTPVYASSALSTTLSNPVVADAAGVLPTIYLNTAILYRVVIADALGNTIKDVDNYIPGTFLAHQGTPGVNGGTASNLTVGLFTGCAGQDLTAGGTKPAPDVVVTSGYNAIGRGGARYIKDAAVNLAFVTAHPGWSFRDSQGNGYRLDETQRLWIEMFGAIGDFDHGPAGTTNGQGHTFTGTNVPVTDSYPAYLGFKDFLKYVTDWPSWDVHYKSVPPVYLGAKAYYSSGTWEFTDTVNLMAEGDGGAGGAASAVIWFAANQCGMIFQGWDTTGTNASKTQSATPYDRGASDSYIRGISVFSLGGTLGQEHHGILIRCRMTVEMCSANQFAGHGFVVRADHSASYKGNANGFRLVRCAAVKNGGDGLRVEGDDANAGVIDQFSAFSNLGFGVNEASGLGNKYLMLQTGYNGCFGAGPSYLTANFYSTFCNYGGDVYRVRPGQEVAARTTTPGTNSAVWVLYATGAVSTLGPTWVNAMTNWVSGGMLWVQGGSNRSTGDGYGETTSEALPWSDAPNSFGLPGNLGFGGAGLYVSNGKLLSNYMGSLNTASNVDYQFLLGGVPGDAATVLARLGLNAAGVSAPWTLNVDANNTIYFAYNGLGNTSPVNFIGNTGNHPYSASMPNGHFVGSVFCTTGSAAPTSGTWERGSRVYNDGSATALGTTDHWVCSVAGTPGTWLAKA